MTILDIAEGELGNGGAKYWTWYGTEPTNWCAEFVQWVYDQAKVPLVRTAWVPDFEPWAQAQGQWIPTDGDPPPGSLVIFDWDGDGLADHVALFESFGDGVVNVIDGNGGGDFNSTIVDHHTQPRSLVRGFVAPTASPSVPPPSKEPFMAALTDDEQRELLETARYNKGELQKIEGAWGPLLGKISAVLGKMANRQFVDVHDAALLKDSVDAIRRKVGA